MNPYISGCSLEVILESLCAPPILKIVGNREGIVKCNFSVLVYCLANAEWVALCLYNLVSGLGSLNIKVNLRKCESLFPAQGEYLPFLLSVLVFMTHVHRQSYILFRRITIASDF